MIINNIPSRKYRLMCAELDAHGFVIYINRINNKCFNLIINGEIIKEYRQRRSCNRQIEKLFNNQIINL